METLRLADGQAGQALPGLPDESGRTIAALEVERDAARLAAAKAEGGSATLRERMEAERARADRAEAERDAARTEREARLLASELALTPHRRGKHEDEPKADPWEGMLA
jgi:hypothetical protein